MERGFEAAQQLAQQASWRLGSVGFSVGLVSMGQGGRGAGSWKVGHLWPLFGFRGDLFCVLLWLLAVAHSQLA